MKHYTQGPETDITIGTTAIKIKRTLLEREDANTPAVQECIHCLDDFLWNYAGLATNDGTEEFCRTFLTICEYNAEQ